jgi:N6-adenosine-specific RNA methylase IME4
MQQNKKYKVLMIDPPWRHHQLGNYGAVHHYDLMSTEEIKGMPIADLVAPDAAVFLWVTNSTMKFGYEILEHWGFEVKGILTWVKMRMGLGNYFRNATEHVLLATRGKMLPKCKNQLSFFVAPIQGHSHKPEEVFAIAERMYPEGPYLELFARRKQPGWDCWGFEAPSQDVTIKGYEIPDANKKPKQKGGSDV